MKPPQSRDWVEKIVIGHNVSYDRARIKEQYFLEVNKLALHTCMIMSYETGRFIFYFYIRRQN